MFMYKIKDSKNQAIHYLNTAIIEAKKDKQNNLSVKIFEDDINTIKKGLLK